MPVRFNESLLSLIEAALKQGLVIDENTVVVRDGTGRLILAKEKVETAGGLEKALRDAVQGYIGSVAVIVGPAAGRLLKDPSLRTVSLDTSKGKVTFRYADRRIVGMDWLKSPAAPKKGAPRMVLGSLKGGVGRSTALVVLAAELARRGIKVLAVDLDLEAPGIGTMLLPASLEVENDRRPKYGVVDYLVENGLNGIPDEDLYDFIGVSPFHEGSIDVLPAVGRETDAHPELMISKLSRALVEDVSEAGTVSLREQIDAMIGRFADRGEYEVILIDARAGMAEISAAPLLGLGAEVVLFGTDQPQTFQGYAYILSHLMSVSTADSLTGENDWRLRLTFVQAKAPASSRKRQAFRERLYELCSSYLYDREISLDYSQEDDHLSPSPAEIGPGIPHDAVHVEYHPDFDAFDPLLDRTQLDREVYKGPFDSFITRALTLLKISDE